MTRIFVGMWLFVAACQPKEDIEQRKIAARKKMEEKVRAVIVELKSDCDSTLMITARTKADSILKQRAKRAKGRKK